MGQRKLLVINFGPGILPGHFYLHVSPSF